MSLTDDLGFELERAIAVDWDHDKVTVFLAYKLSPGFVESILGLGAPSVRRVDKNGLVWQEGNEWSPDPEPQGLDQDEWFLEYPDLPSMIEDLDESRVVLLEATQNSFRVQDRDDIVRLCRETGHDLRLVNTRFIPRVRGYSGFNLGDADHAKDNGSNGKAGDRRDAYCIFWSAALFFDPPPPAYEHEPREAEFERLDRIRKMAVQLRYAGEKSQLSALLHRRLKNRAGYDEFGIRDLIKPGQVSVAVAAARCDTRKEFERCCGLYASGYPGVLRSDIMEHGWGGYGATSRREAFELSEMRKAYRWFYHAVHALVRRARGNDNALDSARWPDGFPKPINDDPVAQHWLLSEL